MKCPSCGTDLLVGTILCDECGGYVPNSPNKSAPENEGVTTNATLILLHSNGQITLDDLTEISLGRDPLNGEDEKRISLADLNALKLGVSRNHAMISKVESKFFIRDLGSTNGTWRNMVRINQNELVSIEDGDIIRLGSLEFQINILRW
jgi:pSer/pThr/pTyr-binding forkhead associated (FHA) protein